MPKSRFPNIPVVLTLLLMGTSAFAADNPARPGEAIAPYIAFLKTQSRTPIDYVMGLFDRYDIVILCERFHPETTQYDFILDLASDKRFLDEVGLIYTELGTSSNRGYVRDFMLAEGLGDREVEARAMHVYRNFYWSPIWEKHNFLDFMKRLYGLNKTLPPDRKVDLRPSDMPFSWEGMTREKYQAFEKILGQRDRIMAEQIIADFKDVCASARLRKKALVIMNYRHAFNDRFMKPGGVKADNVGRYVFEAFPGRTANVLINSVALRPGTTDQNAVTALISGGKWDAAFEAAGNPDRGFDFTGNVFGADRFDFFPFFPHDFKYEDVFTGFIFYKPLKEHKMASGIPGLFGDGYDKILLGRMAVAGSPIPENEVAEFLVQVQTLHEETYDDMPALMEKIKAWLPPGEN